MKALRTIRGVAAAAMLCAGTVAWAGQGEIEAAQQSWEDAFNAGDGAAAAEAVFTEDARLFPPERAMVEGREAIAAFWQDVMDYGIHSLDLGLIDAEIIGDTMIETGTWSSTAPTEGGGEARISGKALVIWKKGEDGTWRISRDMWSYDPEE